MLHLVCLLLHLVDSARKRRALLDVLEEANLNRKRVQLFGSNKHKHAETMQRADKAVDQTC